MAPRSYANLTGPDNKTEIAYLVASLAKQIKSIDPEAHVEITQDNNGIILVIGWSRDGMQYK